MAKHIPRSRRQVVFAEMADAIARPGLLAAALKLRFWQAATAPGASDADVAWRIRWPEGHALAGREFFTLDIKTAKTRVREGALVEPLHGRFLRGVSLHLPGASGGELELVQPPATWVDPKNEKTAAAERLHASALDVVDETRRSTLRLQARSLELKAQMVSDPSISAQLLARSSLAFLRAEQAGCPPETLSEPPEAASGTSGSEGRATDSSRELQLLNAAIAESLLVPGPVARALAQRSGLEDKSLAGTAPSDPLVRL